MDLATRIRQVSDRLYAAVAAPDEWPAALAGLSDLVRGHHLIVVGQTGMPSDEPFVASARVDECDLARFFSPDGASLIAPLFNAVPVGVTSRAAMISDAEFSRSAAYNELVRPINGFHGLHGRHDGPGGFILNVCRPRRAKDFDAADEAALTAMTPHIALAIELRERLLRAEFGRVGLLQVLDRLDAGVIITDGSAQPATLNAKAEQIMAERGGLTVGTTGLTASTSALTRQLRAAIAVAARDSAVAPRRLRVERMSRRLPLLVTVLPIWRFGARIPGAGAARVAILIGEPDAPVRIDRALIADIFRLTPRESEIAVLIADGLDRSAIASRLRLGRGTVHEHLRHIYGKTGVHSQLELAALLRGFVDRFH